MTIQLETGHKQQQELQESLDQVTGRIGKRDTGHLEHMAARREVMQGLVVSSAVIQIKQSISLWTR